MEQFKVESFNLFNLQWALLTAGTSESYNAMTISWGGLGTLWGKPAATVYVKPVRYTHDFMENSDYFTLSFYSIEYRKALNIMGSKSGRDSNKEQEAGLTPVILEHGVTYQEADVTLVCRKMYHQDMVRENMPENVVEKMYTPEEPHTMYIGEVIDIIRK